MLTPTRKKLPYPVQPPLRRYLAAFTRELQLPVDYESLTHHAESYPLLDREGRDTLWRTVTFSPGEAREIYAGLRDIYALLRASGDTKRMSHLAVSRVDYCEFGNSKPFRIRIVNLLNDNQDYFYVKRADASRIYGLELEHLLSPNRMHFLVWGDTLIEEHVVGLPGDLFMREHLQDPGFKEVRIAKEFVKFNERCSIRLLGDMRSYNYVVDITPDFEEVQYRIRPMDFDQQCYDGRRKFYLPKLFKENNPLIYFGIKYLDETSVVQYEAEERSLISLRMKVERNRLGVLLEAMCSEPLAPPEKILQLRGEMAEWHQNPDFHHCRSMGDILKLNMRVKLPEAAASLL